MGSRMRAFDWSKTAIGPVQGWPQSLRSPLSMMLPSKAQIILFWGPEFIVFYNDAYRPVWIIGLSVCKRRARGGNDRQLYNPHAMHSASSHLRDRQTNTQGAFTAVA